MKEMRREHSEILVIGGGIAAMFCAIKAREQGADVLVVDKGSAGRSGQSPYADAFTFTPPGEDVEQTVERTCKVGEYLNHKDWCQVCLAEAYDRYQDLLAMGVQFFKEDGEIALTKMHGGNMVYANLKCPEFMVTMRKYATSIGVRFIDRMMMTDLLVGKDGAVIGAVGLSTQEGELVVFQSKATVLCTGGSAYKPAGWPVHGLTGDGDAMAYRAGARITGKEFVDPHTCFEGNPMYSNFKRKYSIPKARPPIASVTGADGTEVKGIGALYISENFEIHKGNGPIIANMQDGSKRTVNSGITNGMSMHKGEGVWSVGTKCETEIMGLFAAGDALGSRQGGALYLGGMAISGSATTGAIAGATTAEFVKDKAFEEVDGQAIASIEETVYQSLNRQGGYSPRWVIRTLQQYMRPYFIAVIKEEKRLAGTLALVEFLRDHTVPMMKANDVHELILAMEAKNMVLNAEMRLRASMFRKESRGTHYREDYPTRDDENFLAWVTLKAGQEGMEVEKIPVPEAWRPDPSLSYEEKYTTKLPNYQKV